ncbi:ion transport protein [Chloropicon primus]|uniref:Ion transport protein n=1 Tax=Chloropicon primus TaxID=1764295 RepID=A0A5B8MHX5_9CHLO|nr:ion transport protein [Chloropicon primus]|eukprot:QDZ19255.1 ion transport protein [Chloropicon primus]
MANVPHTESRSHRKMRIAPISEEHGAGGDQAPSAKVGFAQRASFGLRKSLAKFLRGQEGNIGPRPEATSKIFEDSVFLPNSNYKLGWDVFLCALIVYSVITVTTRIGFDLEIGITGNDAIIDYTIDSLFALDIITNFFTGFYDPNMVLITSHKQIAKRYLKKWFWIDMGATVPFNVIVELASGRSGSGLKALKLIRFFRLLKLGRLRKLGAAVSNLEEMTGIHPTVFELLRLLAKVLFMSHFVACGWHYISTTVSDGGIFAFIGLEGSSTASRYLMSLNWSIATMTGVGYGDIIPTSVNERVYAIFVQIMGASIFGFLLGNINTILDSINVRASYRRRKMNQVKHYVRQMEFPKELKLEIKRHFRHLCEKKEIFEVEHALSALSSSLYKEIVLQTFYELRYRFPIFIDNGPEFLMGCVSSMLPVAYYPGDEITSVGDTISEIHFLTEGIIHYVGNAAWSSGSGGDTDFFGALKGYERTLTTQERYENARKMPVDKRIVDHLDEGTVVGIFTDGSLLFEDLIGGKLTMQEFTTKAASFCDCYILEKSRYLELLHETRESIQERAEKGERRNQKLTELLHLNYQLMSFSVEGEINIVKMSQEVLVNDVVKSYVDLNNSGYQTIESNNPGGRRRTTKRSVFERVTDQFKGFRPSIVKKSNVVAPSASGISESRRGRTRRGGSNPDIQPYTSRLQHENKSLSEAMNASPYVINHEGQFKVRWEMVLCILILYSAITVPYLLSFDDEVKFGSFFWFLEIFVDTFFVTDLVLNFFTSYYHVGGLGKMRVRNHLRIAEHYLKSKWFVIDFFSSIPFDRILKLYFSSATRFKSLRLIRMLRLTRLMKLFKKSAYLEDLEDENPTLMQASKLLLQVSFSAHFLACAWYYVSIKGQTTCTRESIGEGLYNPHYCNWSVLERENVSGESKIQIYLASLYWAYTTMTTVGYGDIVPGSDSEAVMAVISMIFGVTMFAYVVGSMAVVVTSLNATARRVKQKIDDLDMFLREKDIDSSLHKKVKDYYGYYLRNLYAFDEEILLIDMPYSLRKKCLSHTYGKQLKSIPFFVDWDDFAISQIAPYIKNQQFEEGEIVLGEGEVGTHLFFIEMGCVDVLVQQRQINQLYRGNHFGEVSMLFKVPTTATVRAASTLKVFSIPGNSFKAILRKFHLTKNNLDIDALLTTIVNRVATLTYTTDMDSKIKDRMASFKEKGGPLKCLLLQDDYKYEARRYSL